MKTTALEREVLRGMIGTIRPVSSYDEMVLKLLDDIDTLLERYRFAENQRLCVGDSGGCDGDLTATPHEEKCPAHAKDVTLRPHLYKPDGDW